MMENQQFIDAEYCIDRYFDQHLTTKLDFYIDCRNAAVVGGMSSGIGVMNTLLPSEDYATNVTLNFPANDIEKTCADMGRDLQMTHDKQVLVTTWRNAAVGKIGQARYDELSRQLGVDLATAYVDHRLLMRMVDYEVAKNPIRGSATYILDEARRNSLLSYTSATTSELQQFIDKKLVERYDPSLLERGAGKVLGSLTDLALTAPMMGAGSWATLGKFLAVDLGVGFVGDALDAAKAQEGDVSRIVSAALFEGDANALTTCQKQYASVNPYSSEVVKSADAQLSRKIVRHSTTNPFLTFNNKPAMGLTTTFNLPEIPDYAARLREDMAIQEYFAHLPATDGEQSAVHPPVAIGQAEQNNAPLQSAPQQQVMGWNGLFDTLGLSDFGSVGKNLGYVLAMLPDMLVGMFTGKSRNLKFGDNMLPIASIIAGMFVKNPLLKMLLVGLGGANLLNKAGHEALEGRNGIGSQPVRQFRQYEDEVLDMRISKPAMKGNTLIATIDNIPNVITINDAAADAYYKGLIPLNTLANAVLRKWDEQQQMLQENYSHELSQNESEERTVALR